MHLAQRIFGGTNGLFGRAIQLQPELPPQWAAPFTVSGRLARTWRILYPSASWCHARICSSTSLRRALVTSNHTAIKSATISGRAISPINWSADIPSVYASSYDLCVEQSRTVPRQQLWYCWSINANCIGEAKLRGVLIRHCLMQTSSEKLCARVCN